MERGTVVGHGGTVVGHVDRDSEISISGKFCTQINLPHTPNFFRTFGAIQDSRSPNRWV
jgi:hypothetical protein